MTSKSLFLDNRPIPAITSLMPDQPLVEVFGYPIDDQSESAVRFRTDRLCPFGNKVPNCTKDRISDPLGVCSIYEGDSPTIVCPVRFREANLIASHAADFFFPEGTTWTTLPEVRLKDGNGKAAGNIDMVLVAYDDRERVTDFGSLEVQGVYISGNLRNPFTHYMKDPVNRATMNWKSEKNFPRADYLSSSRKRLAPQLIYKGGILHAWGRKMAVAIDKHFLSELPELPRVVKKDADVAWLIYHLERGAERYELKKLETIYTKFIPALETITKTVPGKESDFKQTLQKKLDEKLGGDQTEIPSIGLGMQDIFEAENDHAD